MDYSQYPLELVDQESLINQSQMLGTTFTSVQDLTYELNKQQPELVDEEIGALIRAKEIEHPQVISDEVVDSMVALGFKQFANYFQIPENRDLLKKIFKYKLILAEIPGINYLSDAISKRIKKELVKRGVSNQTINYLNQIANQADRLIEDNRVWWQVFSINFYNEPYKSSINYEDKYNNLVTQLKQLGLNEDQIYRKVFIDHNTLSQLKVLAQNYNLSEASIYLNML